MSMMVSAQQRYQVGDKATTFKLMSTEKQMVSPEDYPDAKGFIVIFSCNTCPWVKLYEDRIEALHQKFAPQGFPVLAINANDEARSPGDSFEAMQQRAKEKGFTFPYLIDETQEIARAYGATKTPEVFLLLKEGDELVVKYIGAIDDSPRDASQASRKYVEEAIEAIQQGKAIKDTEVKAIGCTIKYRRS